MIGRLGDYNSYGDYGEPITMAIMAALGPAVTGVSSAIAAGKQKKAAEAGIVSSQYAFQQAQVEAVTAQHQAQLQAQALQVQAQQAAKMQQTAIILGGGTLLLLGFLGLLWSRR